MDGDVSRNGVTEVENLHWMSKCFHKAAREEKWRKDIPFVQTQRNCYVAVKGSSWHTPLPRGYLRNTHTPKNNISTSKPSRHMQTHTNTHIFTHTLKHGYMYKKYILWHCRSCTVDFIERLKLLTLNEHIYIVKLCAIYQWKAKLIKDNKKVTFPNPCKMKPWRCDCTIGLYRYK